MLLYNTGARVSEVAQLKVGQLDLQSPARVRLLGKGSKWRTCPLWSQTAKALQSMLEERSARLPPEAPVFVGAAQEGMTRFGIYKRIRHYAQALGGLRRNFFAHARDSPCVSAHHGSSSS